MVVLLQVLAVLAVVFGVAVVLTGRAEGMSEEGQDLADTGIPRDRPMTPQDVIGLRFALAFRGYRMSEVDDALDRLAAELDARDHLIARLRAGTPAPDQPRDEPREEPSEQPQDVPPSGAPGDLPRGTDGREAGWWSPPRDVAEPEYVPSDATGDVPSGVAATVPPAPDAGQPDGFEPAFVPPVAEPDPYAGAGLGAAAGTGAAGGLGAGEAPVSRETEPFPAPDPQPPAPAEVPPVEFAAPPAPPMPAAPDPLSAPLPAAPAGEAPWSVLGTQPAPPPAAESAADDGNPFRPQVPEIPTYDPWAVTPRSRFTEGPTYVEVDDHDDADHAEGIAEHHTGYAPGPATDAPPAAPDDAPSTADAGADGTRDGTTGDSDDERPRPPWQS
ncbi:MAG TPA: DivIVA domain-containing protein [Frankiaceae bacterium]|nr:DivIVA domain-containing protein [Frankiaceae bacterium]